MSNNKIYWNSTEQLEGDKEFMEKAKNEFTDALPVEDFLAKENLSETTTNRRDFLKFMGFSVAAATLAACETPVIKSIPYVVKPEQIIPGVANYYASTFYNGFDFANILVKTREGRPIFIEGNKSSTCTRGTANARVNSSVLDLYSTDRLRGPKDKNGYISWSDADNRIMEKIAALKAKGGSVRVLSNSIISPSTEKVISNFFDSLGETVNAKHVQYDSISAHGILEANLQDFGSRALPDYQFNKAKVIVSVDADFLNSWLLSSKYAADYGSRRNPDGDWMSKHYHFEANMSLSGSNADVRGAIRPSEKGAALVSLYNAIAKLAGADTLAAMTVDNDNFAVEKIEAAAKELWNNKGNSLVVCGSNSTEEQRLTNAINALLGNYGTTISWAKPLYLRKGSDVELNTLIEEMSTSKVDLLFVYGSNPSFNLPVSMGFDAALSKVPFKVSFAGFEDETALNCDLITPDNHYLESWGDAVISKGEYSLIQPTIRNLYKTRQAQASFMQWTGVGTDYYAFLKSFTCPDKSSEISWEQLVHDGVSSLNTPSEEKTYSGSVSALKGKISKPADAEWEVQLYASTAIGDGDSSNNPWLQELPDPLTRVTWDNYITMNPAQMQGVYNIKIAQETPAHLATISVNNQQITLPVVPQPGQKIGTVGVALGYGKLKGGNADKSTGKNAFPLVNNTGGKREFNGILSSLEKTGETYQIASIQTHHTMMGRKIVNETTLGSYKENDRSVWNPVAEMKDAYGKTTLVKELNLWDDHSLDIGHRWGLAIDLNTCIGCGSCVTACHSENNVAVVGKDEIRRTRSMSWLRIDRYFSSDADPKLHTHGQTKNYSEMEVPSKYPRAVFQPVMCQHCNHAPCETVCPVAATTHSNEGLNQMTYNRCIGTRYCANNCPYKVRRFNWFNYVDNKKFKDFNPSQDDVTRMVLNPDVTVRARGVMEKCSMCVQRIQAGKLAAKVDSRKVNDGDITTACASACPTQAITFGDLNDKSSKIAAKSKEERAYHLLEEVGTQPNVWYATKVRNLKEEVNQA